MKKLITMILSVGCLLMAACSDDEQTDVLNIVKANLNMKAAGGEASIEWQATQPVEVSVDADWCEITGQTENAVKIKVASNTDYPGRSVQVVLSMGSERKQLTLVQEGAVFVYDASQAVNRLGDEGGKVEIEADGSFPLEVNIPEADRSWLSFQLSEDGKGGSFIVAPNTTGDSRASLASVTCGDRTMNYSFLQYEAAYLTGTYQGQYFSLLGYQYYPLQDVVISGPDDSGIYTINNLLDGVDTPIMAVYSDGKFVIPSGQRFSLEVQGGVLDLRLGLLSLDGYEDWSTNSVVGLEPVYVKDKGLGLTFSDIGGMMSGSTFAALYFAVFQGSRPAQDIDLMMNILLF